MKKIKKTIIPCLIVTAFLSSCRPGLNDADSVKASVPQNFPIPAAEIEKLFPVKKNSRSGVTLELTIYDYSSGTEVMRYSDEGLSNYTKEGHIKILLKLKKNSKLIWTEFVRATGRTREELLKNLSLKIKKLL